MRIITRKLHKAFRELDRFEEPRAVAFVRVASSGWRARGFRYGVMAVVAMPMLFGVVILVGWVASLGSRTTLAQDIVHTGIALTLGLALTFLAVMLTRDLMLRWRIRRLIRRRGTCQMCNYSLLGMPVGPDLIVTCPECGDQLKADPAMNELATTADGRQTFAPKGQVNSPAVIAARKRRLKLAIRLLIGTPVLLLVLAGITFGIWRYWLASMARQARADRNFEALATALVESAHPAGAVELPNQWEDLIQLISSKIASPRVINNMGDTGALDELKLIQRIQHATRPLPSGSIQDPLKLFFRDVDFFQLLCSVNGARMEKAVNSENMPEYLAALDQTLAAARILDRQAFIVDRVIATELDYYMIKHVRTHAHRYPDDAWRTAVANTLSARARTVPFAHAIEGDRLFKRDVVAWFFSDTSRVERIMLSGKSTILSISSFYVSGRINRAGSYSENLAAIERDTQARKVVSFLPRRERKTPTVPGLSTLIDVYPPRWPDYQDSEDQALATCRAALVILALESYRARSGAYPATLAELGPANPDLDTTDPYSGKPFGYSPTPGSADGRQYRLWSVGNDGIDDGGIDNVGSTSRYYPGLNWAQAGTDVIFNDPPTPATPSPTRQPTAPPGSN